MKNETVVDLQKPDRPPFESWTTSSLRLLPLIDNSKPGAITETTPSPSSSPFYRHGHSLTAATTRDGELFLFGGHANGVKSNDLYSISARKFSITPIRTHGDIPTPRSGHVCAFVSDRLIVWGGETIADGGQTEELDNVLYALDLDNYEWRRLKTSGSSPSGRCGHSASVIGTMLYIFGGHARGVVRDDLWALDLGKKDGKLSWERISIARRGAPKRTGHACIAYKNQIIIFGGTDLEFYYDDTYILDITTRRWTKEDYAGFSVRKDHSASLIDDTVYVFGGRGPDRKDLKDLLAFRITDRRWYAFTFPDGPMPSACSSHGMASIGSRLFVLGGVPSKTGKGESSPAIHILETREYGQGVSYGLIKLGILQRKCYPRMQSVQR
ncbi:hypothetical protein DFH11DRAFT_1506659 [Phellopilus nigrolimitatus]|nr:hypothetical protein DFH11DRAFT_1506659 [Phellopilus nigrolimitatus]